jgi:hypothetical protein
VTSIEGAYHVGCPLMSRADEYVNCTQKFVLKNGSITNLEVANILGI